MNVTPVIRQITDFSFRLSSEDLERYLANPQAWVADVRAQLNGHTPSIVQPATPPGGVFAANPRANLWRASRPSN